MGTRISLKRTSTENTAYVVQSTRTAKIMLSDQYGDRPDKYQQAGRLLDKHGWVIVAGSPPLGFDAWYVKVVSGRRYIALLSVGGVRLYCVGYVKETDTLLPYHFPIDELLPAWEKKVMGIHQVGVLDGVLGKVVKVVHGLGLNQSTKPEIVAKNYRVVDFHDRILGEGTLTEVQGIFLERYPHFDTKHIQPFIYENV